MIAGFFSLVLSLSAVAAPVDDVAVAEVNGRTISGRDVATYLALRGATATPSAELRRRAAEELIDRELIRGFLERNKVSADGEQLAVAVRAAKERLAAGGAKPDEVLASIGVDENRLKAEVALPLAWRRLAGQAITDGRIRERFDRDRRRFDGTRLRVAQIFLKFEPGETAGDAPQTTGRLEALRQEIAAGKLAFDEAARKHSQAPGGPDGGLIGWVGPEGDLPAAVAAAAFALEPGEVSGVIRSGLGAHLVTVLEAEPGDWSLEDARPAIFDELAAELWDETVAAERKAAKIVTKGGSQQP